MIVSPLAARMAAEAGIDLRSSPGERSWRTDNQARHRSGDESATLAAPVSTGTFLRAVEPLRFQPAAVAAASPYRDEPASEIRRTIARRLVTSIGPVPHFFLTSEIEMDRAAEMRRGINALDPDLKISVNDIVIKVVASCACPTSSGQRFVPGQVHSLLRTRRHWRRRCHRRWIDHPGHSWCRSKITKPNSRRGARAG